MSIVSVHVCECVSVRVYARTHACVYVCGCTCVRTHMCVRVCCTVHSIVWWRGGVFSLSKRLHTFVYRKDNDVYFNFQLIQHILLIR